MIGLIQKTGAFGKDYELKSDEEGSIMMLRDGAGNIIEKWFSKDAEPRVHSEFICYYDCRNFD